MQTLGYCSPHIRNEPAVVMMHNFFAPQPPQPGDPTPCPNSHEMEARHGYSPAELAIFSSDDDSDCVPGADEADDEDDGNDEVEFEVNLEDEDKDTVIMPTVR